MSSAPHWTRALSTSRFVFPMRFRWPCQHCCEPLRVRSVRCVMYAGALQVVEHLDLRSLQPHPEGDDEQLLRPRPTTRSITVRAAACVPDSSCQTDRQRHADDCRRAGILRCAGSPSPSSRCRSNLHIDQSAFRATAPRARNRWHGLPTYSRQWRDTGRASACYSPRGTSSSGTS